jgi:hypothetical protein
MFLQHCFYLLDILRVLLPKDLVSDGGREHVAGDVPGQSGKGQDGKREKYKGCD